jgi:hypothetical protein
MCTCNYMLNEHFSGEIAVTKSSVFCGMQKISLIFHVKCERSKKYLKMWFC